MTNWQDSPLTRALGLRVPIIQGPFGGGLSSPALAAAVSNLGGLGSYGAQGHSPQHIQDAVAAIRERTAAPFAMNLWVSTEDPGAADVGRETFEEALAPLLVLYRELGVEPPRYTREPSPRFEDQAAALLDLRVPAFSFVFGVPDGEILAECRRRGIVTLGAATTVDEALALEAGGVDVVVASGSEGGGHRPSFLGAAESSLTGTFALVPQVVDAVRLPVVAAGGIADGRTVAAALTLGAAGVQVGTAFLACEESNASPAYRAALFGPARRQTLLTRALSGRLGRALRNPLADHLERLGPALPYPVLSRLLAPLRREALARDRIDLIGLWAGQSASLLRHRRAKDLFDALVFETDAIIGARGR
jgi:nitronate monooxygenase